MMQNQSFEFNGDWVTEIKLSEFSILNSSKYFKDKPTDARNLFELEIFDLRNKNPDPETFQLNTINYLLDSRNQIQILQNLLNYSRDVIYPHYKEFMQEIEYPECYPPLTNYPDLSQLFGVERIIIKRIEKDDFAYYILDCRSCLDFEHGITVTLYKNEVIDHGEDWDDQKVCEHKGIDYPTYHEKAVKEFNKNELTLVNPHPKYGKLKPYQKNQNDFYPVGLYHDGQFERLIKELEDGTIAKANAVMARLLPLSINHEKEEMTQYLLPKFGKEQHSAFKYALKKDRYDILSQLIRQGYDINQQVAQFSGFFDTIQELVRCVKSTEDYRHILKRLNFLLEKGFNPLLEDGFGRNAYFAVERINNAELKERVSQILESLENT